MKRSAIVAMGMAGVLMACSTTSSQLVKTWRDPTFVGRQMHKVLVIGLSPTAKNQQTFEYALSDQFKKVGLQPLPGYDVLPRDKMADEATILGIVKKEAIDLVVVTKLVTVRSEKEYVPGSYTPGPAYYGMYGYYSASYSAVYSPGYMNEAQAAYLETNAYDVETKKLVWSGLTRTFDYSSVDQAAQSVAPTIVRALQDQGIL